jgi:ATP-binding cassette subfamily B protein
MPIARLKITDLLRPHWKALTIGFVAVVGEGVADLLDPWPLKLVLDNVLRSKEGHGWLNRWVHDWSGGDRMGMLEIAAAMVLLIAILDAICSFVDKSVTTSVGQYVTHDLRKLLYSRIQRLSLAFHDQSRTGDLISRVTSDIDAIQNFIVSGLLSVLINVITLVGMVIVMFYINWRFTLIALSIAPPLFAVVYTYTRKIKKAARELRKKEGEVVSVIEEVLGSIRVVRAFAREDYEQRRLEVESMESVEMALKARALKARLAPIVGVIVALGTAMVLWFGGRMVLSGTLSIGSLVVFILYLRKMYKPMQELSKMTDTYSKAAVGYERICEVLETEGEVGDAPEARNAPPIKGKIEFEHVSFGYSAEREILHDVSMKIEPGQVAALVGPTGAGKSTIISLIPRFYDPTAGVIKIDEIDVKRFKQKSLRHQISFVLQETVLFHGPIWQNISYGKPEATRKDILWAAEMANAHEFIEKLEEGYDTMVGERGITLSGGQRQRIAIARAIIRNSPILIMDEPTSGLDASSEKLVFEALDRMMVGKTAIVIAHRLSTIRRADVIFVVDDGRIKEQGTHDQLCKAGGLYSKLYEIQFRQKEDMLPDAVAN